MSTWTPDDKIKLHELWDAGDSASKIAAQLPGKTRNAVIGMAHRLGLARRLSPIEFGLDEAARRERRVKAAKKRNEVAKAARRAMGIEPKPWMARFGPRRNRMSGAPKMGPILRATMSAEDHAPVATRTHFDLKVERPRHIEPMATTFKSCQWIAVEKQRGWTDADKCGAPTFSGAYCEAHCRRAWQPAKQTDARMAKSAEYTPRDAANTLGRL